jgi:hypothetical protein
MMQNNRSLAGSVVKMDIMLMNVLTMKLPEEQKVNFLNKRPRKPKKRDRW